MTLHGKRCFGRHVASVDFGQQHSLGFEHGPQILRVTSSLAPPQLEIAGIGSVGFCCAVPSHVEHRRLAFTGRRRQQRGPVRNLCSGSRHRDRQPQPPTRGSRHNELKSALLAHGGKRDHGVLQRQAMILARIAADPEHVALALFSRLQDGLAAPLVLQAVRTQNRLVQTQWHPDFLVVGPNIELDRQLGQILLGRSRGRHGLDRVARRAVRLGLRLGLLTELLEVLERPAEHGLGFAILVEHEQRRGLLDHARRRIGRGPRRLCGRFRGGGRSVLFRCRQASPKQHVAYHQRY